MEVSGPFGAGSQLRHIGSCRNILEGHMGLVRCLAVRGSKLISAGDRKKVNIWNIEVRAVDCFNLSPSSSLDWCPIPHCTSAAYTS